VVSVGLQKSRDATFRVSSRAPRRRGPGIRFPKHLQRTRILLHLVDIAPLDPDATRCRRAPS
jgi:GTPase involved in cell partitioning and DNA repair